MLTRCYMCGGTITKRQVTLERNWGGTRMLIEGVPAEVCESCGEQYFDPDTCAELDQLRTEPPSRTIEVPVYRYPRVPA